MTVRTRNDGGPAQGAAGKDALVDALVADLAPVAPLRLGRAVALALALEVAVALVSGWASGVEYADMARMADPLFAAVVLSMAAAAAASGAATARLCVPGREVPAWWRAAVLALPVLLSLFVVAVSPWGGTWKGFTAVLVESLPCVVHLLAMAVPAWIAGLLLLRRLAPLDPLRVGLFSGASALLTAAPVMHLACPSCDSWHLAFAHYLPVLLAAWGASVGAVLVLGRGGSARPR